MKEKTCKCFHRYRMELEKYKVLLKAIETQSLSSAASELGYSISGISRIIHSLEKELEIDLLERSRDGVLPSSECKKLLPSIKDFVKAGELVLSQAKNITNVPVKIRIGVAHLRIYSWLITSLISYKKENKEMDVDLIYGTSSILAKQVEQGQLHFAIISKREGDFKWDLLWMDEAVAWVPASNELSVKESIPLSAYEKESCVFPFLSEETDYSLIFNKYKINPNVQIVTSDEYATYSVVESGLGISINLRISSLIENKKLKVISLNPKIYLPIGIAYSNELSKEAKKIMNDLQSSCKLFIKNAD